MGTLTPTACAIRLLATPLSGQEHDPRPPRQTSRHRRGTQPGLEHLQVTLTQNQSRSRSIRAIPLIILNTNHKTTNNTQ